MGDVDVVVDKLNLNFNYILTLKRRFSVCTEEEEDWVARERVGEQPGSGDNGTWKTRKSCPGAPRYSTARGRSPFAGGVG